MDKSTSLTKKVMSSTDTTNKKYLTFIFLGLSFIGILISLFFGNTPNKMNTDNGKANAIIYGYSMIIFSLVGLLLVQFAIFSENSPLAGIIDFIKNIFQNSLPTILLIFILYWIVDLNISFHKKINNNKIPQEYKIFFTSSVILTLFQLGFIVKSILEKIGINTGNINIIDKFGSTFSIVLIILNSIFVGMMQVLLKYYSTDG